MKRSILWPSVGVMFEPFCSDTDRPTDKTVTICEIVILRFCIVYICFIIVSCIAFAFMHLLKFW